MGRPQSDTLSGKGEVMDSEKFLITYDGKRHWGPEGGAQKCGRIEQGRNSERSILVLGLRLSRTLGLDNSSGGNLKKMSALQGSIVLGTRVPLTWLVAGEWATWAASS